MSSLSSTPLASAVARACSWCRTPVGGLGPGREPGIGLSRLGAGEGVLHLREPATHVPAPFGRGAVGREDLTEFVDRGFERSHSRTTSTSPFRAQWESECDSGHRPPTRVDLVGGPLRGCNRPVPDPVPRLPPPPPAPSTSRWPRRCGSACSARASSRSAWSSRSACWSPGSPTSRRRSSPGSSCWAPSAWSRWGCWSAYATGCCGSTTTGYRVRVLRTAEARSARWTDVLDLQTGDRVRRQVPGAAPARRAYDGPAGRRDRGRSGRPDRGADHPPRPGTRVPPPALTAPDPDVPDFSPTRRMGTLWPAVPGGVA